MYVTNYPLKHSQRQTVLRKSPQMLLVLGEGIMMAWYDNVTSCTELFDSTARQIRVIKQSIKKDSVKFEIKSEITLQVVQSCSLAIRIVLDIREFLVQWLVQKIATEIRTGRTLLSGQQYFRGSIRRYKVYVIFEEPLLSEFCGTGPVDNFF